MERQAQNACSQHSKSKREMGIKDSDRETQPWRSSVSWAHLRRSRPSHFGHMKAKNWLTGKDPGAGKDGGQEERGMTEGEMVGWHHWLDGREFEQSPGVDEGQGSLACCSPWGRKSQTWLSGWKTTAKTFSSGGDPLSMWLLSLDCGLIRLTLPCFAIRKGPCLWHIRFCLSSEHWEKESSFCFVLWRLNDTVS